MDYSVLYLNQINVHYYTARELQYSAVYNYFLSPLEIKEFYNYKDNIDDGFYDFQIDLELKTFNYKKIYFSKCSDLSQYMANINNLLLDDLVREDEPLAIRNLDEILRSRIFSEVEGTLNIENVPTTRKRVADLLLKDEKPKNKNDQIIKNMAHGIEFVFSKPEFNKNNLYKLYNMLSEGQLDFDHKLKDNDLYRYDDVYVGDFIGCPVDKLEESMDSLFLFVNKNINNPRYSFFLPHIAHYYILYIHPYFDFNGRTARMVSLWVSLLVNKKYYPPFISDAINQTKNEYYSVLEESRNSHNDITYFLLYICDITISYFLAYQNIEHIDKTLVEQGISLSNLDKDYIKRIMVSTKGAFTYIDFVRWNHIDITKQGALKILNRFVKYDILLEVNTTNNKKYFKLNDQMITYKKK